jgi:transcriptional regulator with XRE-family HTH domain
LLNWSQAELAAKAGLSRATVADFERGLRVPIGNNLRALKLSFENSGIVFESDADGSVAVRLKG